MVLGLEQGLGLGLYQVEVLVQDQMDMDQVKNNRSICENTFSLNQNKATS